MKCQHIQHPNNGGHYLPITILSPFLWIRFGRTLFFSLVINGFMKTLLSVRSCSHCFVRERTRTFSSWFAYKYQTVAYTEASCIHETEQHSIFQASLHFLVKIWISDSAARLGESYFFFYRDFENIQMYLYLARCFKFVSVYFVLFK